MAVVNRRGAYGAQYISGTSPGGQKYAAGVYSGAPVKGFVETTQIVNGDSATSTYLFGYIPSNAVICSQTGITNDVITGVTDYDVGIYSEDGTLIDADIIINGLNLATTQELTTWGRASSSRANMPKMLWEQAGLSEDPGTMFQVRGTINANSAATGNVTLFMQYYAA